MSVVFTTMRGQWDDAKSRPAGNRRLASSFVFNRAADGHGLRLTDMDCEKILVSDDGLPIDGFCRLHISRR